MDFWSEALLTVLSIALGSVSWEVSQKLTFNVTTHTGVLSFDTWL